MTNVMNNHSIRQRILIYIGQHKGSSASELSLALRVTTSDIRHHLLYLCQTNQIQVTGIRNENRKGRPARVYDLSDQAIGGNLNALAGYLLDMLIVESGPGKIEFYLKQLAERVVSSNDIVTEKNVTKKLAFLILSLNKLGYQSKWEAHVNAPRVIFEHCPYKQIIKKHPELCSLDKIILENSLQAEIKQTARLERNLRGTEFCMFEIITI